HGVTRPGPILGEELPGLVVTINRRPNSVHHVGAAVHGVVFEGVCAGGGIHEVREITKRVVLVFCVAVGVAPAVGEPVVRIVGVAQDFQAGLVQLVGHAPILIVMPRRCLVLPVSQGEQVAGGVVGV